MIYKMCSLDIIFLIYVNCRYAGEQDQMKVSETLFPIVTIIKIASPPAYQYIFMWHLYIFLSHSCTTFSTRYSPTFRKNRWWIVRQGEIRC